MKTINFELSKRLNDLGLLDNIETKYKYFANEGDEGIYYLSKKQCYYSDEQRKELGFIDYKTLTLEETIEFLLTFIFKHKNNYLQIKKNEKGYIVYYEFIHWKFGYTLLEAIEKMIEYLLDNNLLGKQ